LDINERLQEAQRYVDICSELRDSYLLEHAYWQLGDVYRDLGDTLQSKQLFNQGKTIASQYGWSLGDNRSGLNEITFALYFTTIYKDDTRQLSFDSIQNNPPLFELNNLSNNLDTNAVYWSKLKLRGNPDQADEYIFQISSDYYGQKSWNHIQAYLVREDGTVEKQQSGFALQQEGKAIPYPANLFRFEIAQNEKAVLYLRLEGVEPDKKPSYISINLVDKGMYHDINGGYKFDGQFYLDYGDDYSFVSNYIYHHEIVEDTTGTMSIDTVYNNWHSLDRKDWMNVKPAIDKVYWLKAKFIGSPIFNGEQVIHVTNWANNDLRSFDYVDAYIPNAMGVYFLFLFFAEKNWLHLYLASFVLGWFIAFGLKGENYSHFVALPIWKEILGPLNFSSFFLVFFGLIKFTEL